jgi:hypothetical protein
MRVTEGYLAMRRRLSSEAGVLMVFELKLCRMAYGQTSTARV